ncbi:YlzJ-like family protein [Cohnella caldifontis]|uniref:YlzJ-like family protein n=1 Tax=Cohnella caldifontis TaxID=3027471 RepID=UPI0023EB6395|nr:YlzJ-like family protein [Cohnella sp. YIM B05605]
MSLYTTMPLELVLDGWNRPAEPGPFLDLNVRGITMRVVPVAPGIGRIERLLHAPLDSYLDPALSPGQTIVYGSLDA